MLFFFEMDVSEMKKWINEYRVPDPSPVRGPLRTQQQNALFVETWPFAAPGLRLRGTRNAWIAGSWTTLRGVGHGVF